MASTKIGTTITNQLKLSVLEDALLGFAQLFGVGVPNATVDAAQAVEPDPTQKGPAK